MQCERCGKLMAPGKEAAHNGQFLCRECFMDVLSPTGVCNTAIQRGILTPRQRRIMAALSDNDGVAFDELAAGLALPAGDLERELSALARLEKVRESRKDGKKVFRVC